jgi:asparagine synthase (glutamine-hydrolysing)
LCGIVGISLKNNQLIHELSKIDSALKSIKHRGPDNLQSIKCSKSVALGHARLSIIDLSSTANQPMVDGSGRYTLVFNGEIYNFQALKSQLINKGYQFTTHSDTEVLLNHLIEFGADGINKLNGFFAFAFYDNLTDKLLLARDRFGIKPLLFYQDDNKFIFSSELQAFFSFDIDKTLNDEALDLLFTLTYVPAPLSMLQNVKKAKPGCYYVYENHQLSEKSYYQPSVSNIIDVSFETSKQQVKELLHQSVKLRMVSDVDLGAFLSGGVDSSIISTIAKDYKSDLKTFSVGFDDAFFDESKYADDVVKKIGTKHTKILLDKADFKQNFEEFIDKVTEPFADSSAYAVYLLTKKTKEGLTVALSGDGADEVFGGYRKHYAEYIIQNTNAVQKGLIKTAAFLLRFSRSSRAGRLSDANRKLQKLASSYSMSPSQRYWKWASFIDIKDRGLLLKKSVVIDYKDFIDFEEPELGLNEVLLNDQKLVLPNDMLTKVDMMSMANSLEVRTPFLDHHLIDYVNGLPSGYKVNKQGRKQVLVEAFKDRLPESVYKRTKKGFEIPLENWLSDNIDEMLSSQIFSKEYIEKQGLFSYEFIKELRINWKKKRFTDSIYLIWTLLIFQNWWDKYINE